VCFSEACIIDPINGRMSRTVLARAISFEGKWPVVGGVKGTDISLE
jgi:hypothetical protein